MAKLRLFSAQHDFNTGFIAKICIIIGIALIAFFGLSSLISIYLSDQPSGVISLIVSVVQIGKSDIIPALAIIALGVGIIIWFLHRQFSKLAEIADEIEQLRNEE